MIVWGLFSLLIKITKMETKCKTAKCRGSEDPFPCDRPLLAIGGHAVFKAVLSLGCCSLWQRQYEEHLTTLQPPDPDADIFSGVGRFGQAPFGQ